MQYADKLFEQVVYIMYKLCIHCCYIFVFVYNHEISGLAYLVTNRKKE